MSSLEITLPEPIKLFVKEQVSKREYCTVSEYLGALISEARRRADQLELESMLLSGFQSPTIEIAAADWSAMRDRVLSRSPELQGQE